MKTQPERRTTKIVCRNRKRKRLVEDGIYFTKRENRCLKLLLKGKTIGEIAVKLNITRGTVYDYFYNIQSKTGCCNNVEIIKFIQLGKFIRGRRFIPDQNIDLS